MARAVPRMWRCRDLSLSSSRRKVEYARPKQGIHAASRLIPRLLLDIQNRGQLAAGMSVYQPGRTLLVDTYKDVGTVSRGVSPQSAGRSRSDLGEVRRACRDRTCAVCHLREGRSQLCTAVRTSPPRKTKVLRLRI